MVMLYHNKKNLSNWLRFQNQNLYQRTLCLGYQILKFWACSFVTGPQTKRICRQFSSMIKFTGQNWLFPFWGCQISIFWVGMQMQFYFWVRICMRGILRTQNFKTLTTQFSLQTPKVPWDLFNDKICWAKLNKIAIFPFFPCKTLGWNSDSKFFSRIFNLG
jgi:hypothetical protein